jgi:hypothetical protein
VHFQESDAHERDISGGGPKTKRHLRRRLLRFTVPRAGKVWRGLGEVA